MKDLFGNDIPEKKEPPKKLGNKSAVIAHATLRQMHGEIWGKKCKDCARCITNGTTTKFYKCELFSTSHSESTDWRANWTACGKFKEKE